VLGEAAPIEEAIHKWRRSIPSGTVNETASSLLRERVWRPLRESLFKDTIRLFIAPDGQLALVPFEAIRLEDGRYLVEQFHVSYLSNGRDLMPRLGAPGEPGPAVVVSDPNYETLDASGATLSAKLLASVGQARSAEFSSRGHRFQSLPGFSREAHAVADAWRKSRPNEELVLIEGAAADEETLNQLRRPQVLHLVTHGFFLPDLQVFQDASEPSDARPTEPEPSFSHGEEDRGLARVRPKPQSPEGPAREDPRLRSGLAMAGANRWLQRIDAGRSDGLLTALEVENLNLWGTDLVVLSACETGLGEVQVGEGVLGLRRAFQQAGARTVLASLWKVPDAETEQLMTRFFELWLAGTSKSEALRSAQLELITRLRNQAGPKRRYAHPLYWGGFICHGSPN
jgi:CHAT domain-containing protein